MWLEEISNQFDAGESVSDWQEYADYRGFGFEAHAGIAEAWISWCCWGFPSRAQERKNSNYLIFESLKGASVCVEEIYFVCCNCTDRLELNLSVQYIFEFDCDFIFAECFKQYCSCKRFIVKIHILRCLTGEEQKAKLWMDGTETCREYGQDKLFILSLHWTILWNM